MSLFICHKNEFLRKHYHLVSFLALSICNYFFINVYTHMSSDPRHNNGVVSRLLILSFASVLMYNSKL